MSSREEALQKALGPAFAVVEYQTTDLGGASRQLKNKFGQAGGRLKALRRVQQFDGELILLFRCPQSLYPEVVETIRERWFRNGWDDSVAAVVIEGSEEPLNPSRLDVYRGDFVWRTKSAQRALALALPSSRGHRADGFSSESKEGLGTHSGEAAVDPDDVARRLSTDLFLPVEWAREVVRLAIEDKAVVFYGPPGTGKTFLARRLAELLQGDESRRTFVQLHPSYSYEHFFEGYRPTVGPDGSMALRLRPGPLRRLVAAMGADPALGVMVLDEMNRGNLAKVFGELYFLLEYRESSIELMYAPVDDEGVASEFSLPETLVVLGSMNTADRSVALVDQAIRRRFRFVPLFPHEPPLAPGNGHPGVLRAFLRDSRAASWLPRLVDYANELLDEPNAAIGPSHFLKLGDPANVTRATVRRIWKYTVLPTIQDRLAGSGRDLSEFDFDALLAAVETGEGHAPVDLLS